MVARKTSYQGLYKKLQESYGPQGWWPIINGKTLICEYGTGAPRNEAEMAEICIGALLAQNTSWYPGVVRALQQLKLGRPFKKQELEAIRQAEIRKGRIREKPRKQTTDQILTQNTSWKNVEKAIACLKRDNLVDFSKIASVDAEKLALLIKPSGYYNQKAKRLKLFAEHVVGNYGSLKRMLSKGASELRTELLSLHGIGPETADSIILYAAGKPVFVIDAYTKRIFARIGLSTEGSSYGELQALFMESLPSDASLFREYHALIVELGKNVCRKKPLCGACPLKRLGNSNI